MAFQKVEKKIEVYDDGGPFQKAYFWYFPNFAHFSSKCVNFYIFFV